MEFVALGQEDLHQYENWLSQVKNGHVLQSAKWARFKQGEWEPHFFWLKQGETIVGCACALARKIPFLNRHMLYLPRGPVLTDYGDKGAWQTFVKGITEFAREHGVVFVKIDPAVTADNDCAGFLPELGFRGLKTDRGFGGGIQPAATIRVKLAGSVDEIYKGLPKKTRYSIRYAAKHGVEFRQMGVEGLDDFYAAMQSTAKRASFALRPRSYYQRLFDIFGDDVTLVNAYYEGELISSGLYIKFGDKVWALYGGATDKHTNLQVGPALEWTAMQWAKKKGAALFDFFGIPVYRKGESKKNRGIYGIYKFKKSFAGEELDFIGEYDLPVSKGLYWVWTILDFGRRVVIALKKLFS